MTAYTINLKRRHNKTTFAIGSEGLMKFAASATPEKAMEFLQQLTGQLPAIHDKFWLEQIVNWVPDEKGLALTEMAKWIKLAKRVAELDEEQEGAFTLSQYQVDLIWSRITDPAYKLRGMDSSLVEFLTEFMGITGKHFPDEDPS